MKIKEQTDKLLRNISVNENLPFYANFKSYCRYFNKEESLFDYINFIDLNLTSYRCAVRQGLWFDSLETWLEDTYPEA